MTGKEILGLLAAVPAVLVCGLAIILGVALLVLACTAWLWGPILAAIWLLS